MQVMQHSLLDFRIFNYILYITVTSSMIEIKCNKNQWLLLGPSKAEVDFKDRKDGSCHVSYIVEEPGEYSVGIRFNDTHIPGSPYKVKNKQL